MDVDGPKKRKEKPAHQQKYSKEKPRPQKIMRIFLLILIFCSCCSYKLPKFVGKAIAQASICSGMLLVFDQVATADEVKSVKDIVVSYQEQKTPVKTLLGSKATLIVNFAGQCDLPADGEPQCGGLVKLYNKYKGDGLQILAFPSDQFRDASMLGEKESEEEVRANLKKQYGIEFPILDYVAVNGGDTTEIYKVMKDIKSISTKDLKKIEWNFEKFLLNSDGVPVRRYRPGILPSQVEGDVNDLIKSGKLKPRQKAMLGV